MSVIGEITTGNIHSTNSFFASSETLNQTVKYGSIIGGGTYDGFLTTKKTDGNIICDFQKTHCNIYNSSTNNVILNLDNNNETINIFGNLSLDTPNSVNPMIFNDAATTIGNVAISSVQANIGTSAFIPVSIGGITYKIPLYT